MEKKQIPNLAFELGFDWNTQPIQGVRDGVYPLQIFLVNRNAVISSCDPSQIRKNYLLSFRIYDFTDALSGASPNALQILFTSARDSGGGEPSTPFSPIKNDDDPVAQMAATDFDSIADASTSIAFSKSARAGWTIQWKGTFASEEGFRLAELGRFKFRALLTASVPGEMARFYRVDPEMVIGDDQ